MRDPDHILLANYLLARYPTPAGIPSQVFRVFFHAGNLLPDFNPFTYLRGIRKSKRMVGHDRLYSAPTVEKIIRHLLNRGIRKPRDCYAFGAMIHYIADGFTYAHTPGFHENLRMHKQYEAKLHLAFQAAIARAKAQPYRIPKITDPVKFLRKRQAEYEAVGKSLQSDCATIIFVCETIYAAISLRGQ